MLRAQPLDTVGGDEHELILFRERDNGVKFAVPSLLPPVGRHANEVEIMDSQ